MRLNSNKKLLEKQIEFKILSCLNFIILSVLVSLWQKFMNYPG